MTDDRDLRERFASLREADRTRAPSFEHLLRRSRRDSRSGTRLVAAGLVAALVVAVSLLLSTRDRAVPAGGATIPSIASWRAPTDFLLATPGRDLLRTVPDIGAMPSAAPAAGTRRPISHRHHFDKEQYT